jgi:hypothetical protein
LTIAADQHDITVGCHAQAIRPMGFACWRGNGGMPSDQPITPVRGNGQLFAVVRRLIVNHFLNTIRGALRQSLVGS